MEQVSEISKLRIDLNALKQKVEQLSLLLNKRLIRELQAEAESIKEGEYLTEEEFEEKHKVKIL